jgi:spermidine synthase
MLYSREFMQQVRRRLAPGGLYVQWAPTERVVATFTSVFEHVVLVQPANILLGSDRPIAFDPAAFTERLRSPAVAQHIARGNPDPRVGEQMVRRISERPQVWGPGDARDPDVLTDMVPRDEFFVNNPRRTLWPRQPAVPPEPEESMQDRAGLFPARVGREPAE